MRALSGRRSPPPSDYYDDNGWWALAYIQGVILGGLAALFEITGDRAYLTQGESIASAALSQLTTQGILAEPL